MVVKTTTQFIFFLLLNIWCTSLYAQKPTQTIRGLVLDADSKTPLVGATISIQGNENPLATTSTENGAYQIDEVPVGRYSMEINYLGYQKIYIPELLIESGKEFILDINLEESTTDLDAVVVQESRANRSGAINSMASITVEEIFRFPATFYDPARLAGSFAGVVTPNDQANHISIRGNSPNSMVWRLEGAEIVNPNHTNNAGTAGDRATQNGGGVNILSAQLLGTTEFLTGAFPAGYGNALSGVMDMNLRKGNDRKHEFTTQFGLIGIDLSAEGPISKKSKASYLVNYRYSFTGLLSALGVSLGEETINYEDLALHLNFPTKKAGTFTLFGIGGRSSNVFEAVRDTSIWEFQNDRKDITFRSKMGAAGITHTLPLGNKSVLKTAVVASHTAGSRTGYLLTDEFIRRLTDQDTSSQTKYVLTSSLSHKLNKNNRIKLGLSVNQFNYSLEASYIFWNLAKGKGSGLLFQPYVNWTANFASNITLNAGLHLNTFSFNNSSSIEPRVSIQWPFKESQRIGLAYGRHSQLQAPQLYFTVDQNTLINPNKDLDFTKADHLVFSYNLSLNKNATAKAELYYQSLTDVPVSATSFNSFSALNLLEEFVTDTLTNTGSGRNYGIELTYQQLLNKGFFLLANTTLYESKYKGSDGIERDTRFNGNYIFNLTIGKEFNFLKKGKSRILGVNARMVYFGGFRDTPIDVAASEDQLQTIYQTSAAFTIKQKDYFKTDLRVYYKNNKKNFSSTVALDIQNVTNQKNIAFTYYDLEQQNVVTKNQLGLIPILSYRLEF